MKKLFILCISLSALIFSSEEKILNFAQDITINKDASLTVTESITVLSQNQRIVHGILREFPTKYKDTYGNNYNVPFDVKEVLKNNIAEPYAISHASNGKIIKIGSKNIVLAPGIYEYKITYQTDRQILFDDKGKDELYWNVTGNGWRLPIDKASATVHFDFLPENKRDFQVYGYTGYQGESYQDYKYQINKSDVYVYSTDKLRPGQGLTISIRWPSGYLEKPSTYTKIYYFFYDNFYILLLILALIITLIIYIRAWLKARITKIPGTVIPRFYPPENMAPSQVRFLKKMAFDSKAFASELVNMAVLGFFKIESGRNLVKNEAPPKDAPDYYYNIYDSIFLKENLVKLEPDNSAKVFSIERSVKLHITPGYKYLISNEDVVWICGAISFFSAILAIFFDGLSLASFILIALIAGINFLFAYLIKTYTIEGRKIVDTIDGFKLFLKTTETDRLKIIGTPPDKTPALYEKYLPYAIALDVEDQWSKQFVPIFEKLKSQGHPYTPIWYVGTPFSPYSFSRTVGSTLASTISASSQAPGSSSGSGGRGSSGGGGGGGGGGGW